MIVTMTVVGFIEKNLLIAFSILSSSSAKPCSSCQLWTSFAKKNINSFHQDTFVF